MARVGADQEFHLLQAEVLRLFHLAWVQLNAEAPAGHAQALHLAFDGAGQPTGCFVAQSAQFGCLLLIMTRVGGQLLGQAFRGFVVGIEGFQFVEQALLQFGQLGRLDPVLARQGVDVVEALFQLLLARRVGVEMVEEAVQFAHGFLDLDLCAGQ
ncbi:hypothetical protein D3C84_759130 [compost metagenome]